MTDSPDTPIIVHGIAGSPYVRAVLVALEEKGLAWRLAALRPGETKQPAHLARHPFGRIPAIAHGDFTLYETQAIVRYVDRLAPTPALVPADARAEARMNQVMGVVDWYLFPGAVGVAFPRVVAPRLGFPPDESTIAPALPKVALCLDALAAIMGDSRFIAGEAFTLADVMLAPQLDFVSQAPEGRDLLAGHGALQSWLTRVNARPSMIATTWDALDARLAKAA